MWLKDLLNWQTNTKNVQAHLNENANIRGELGIPHCLVWAFNIEDGRAAANPSAAAGTLQRHPHACLKQASVFACQSRR
jgi:hypothetical protein